MNLRGAGICLVRIVLELIVGGVTLGILAAGEYAARNPARK
jgi:hypothetical protein